MFTELDAVLMYTRRFIRRCPVPFLRSDCLSPMLRVAIAGLSLEHREAHESVTLFLLYLVRAARDNSVSQIPLRYPARELVADQLRTGLRPDSSYLDL